MSTTALGQQESVKGAEPETPRSAKHDDSVPAVKCLKSGPGWNSGTSEQDKFLGENEISDEELIARVAYAEVHGANGPGADTSSQIEDAKGIAETILNRSLVYYKQTGKSLPEMIYKRNVYFAIQGKNNKPSPDFLCPKDMKLWNAIRKHAHGIYEDGSIRVLSGDATAFYLGNGKTPPPKWAVPAKQVLPKGATQAKRLKFYKVNP